MDCPWAIRGVVGLRVNKMPADGCIKARAAGRRGGWVTRAKESPQRVHRRQLALGPNLDREVAIGREDWRTLWRDRWREEITELHAFSGNCTPESLLTPATRAERRVGRQQIRVARAGAPKVLKVVGPLFDAHGNRFGPRSPEGWMVRAQVSSVGPGAAIRRREPVHSPEAEFRGDSTCERLGACPRGVSSPQKGCFRLALTGAVLFSEYGDPRPRPFEASPATVRRLWLCGSLRRAPESGQLPALQLRLRRAPSAQLRGDGGYRSTGAPSRACGARARPGSASARVETGRTLALAPVRNGRDRRGRSRAWTRGICALS
jgi:hypothetical protein